MGYYELKTNTILELITLKKPYTNFSFLSLSAEKVWKQLHSTSENKLSSTKIWSVKLSGVKIIS